jgi:holo-[acyl-carrier protein] synthase
VAGADARDGRGGEAVAPPPLGTTELGIDIIRVSRIADSLARFGERFTNRVLTPREAAYVRGRAETMAGRWAAKEAVSKVLGLGVRGIGWRDIEIERLPTGQPAVRLHGRAARRAEQLGMGRVAISISHESDFAVAIAYGVRTEGGRFLFPPDIEERLDEREAALLRRFERLRGMARDAAAIETNGGDGADPETRSRPIAHTDGAPGKRAGSRAGREAANG